ncbi:hypothetical protein EDB83DRAFT_185276 [Lactarius deliciosus]|nr:hypothetical protein EDB83DRAFT_185276 [Lactarius deliciosus]
MLSWGPGVTFPYHQFVSALRLVAQPSSPLNATLNKGSSCRSSSIIVMAPMRTDAFVSLPNVMHVSWPRSRCSESPTSLRIPAGYLQIFRRKAQDYNEVQVGDGPIGASVLDDGGHWWCTCTFQCALLPRVGSCSHGWTSNFHPCNAQTLDFTTSQKCRLRSCTTILLIALHKPEFLLICWSRLQMSVRPCLQARGPRIQPD